MLENQQVTAATLTPTVLSTLDRSRLGKIDTLITTGEACPTELATCLGAGSADAQRLRTHRDHHLGHLQRAAVGGAGGRASEPRSPGWPRWCSTTG